MRETEKDPRTGIECDDEVLLLGYGLNCPNEDGYGFNRPIYPFLVLLYFSPLTITTTYPCKGLRHYAYVPGLHSLHNRYCTTVV